MIATTPSQIVNTGKIIEFFLDNPEFISAIAGIVFVAFISAQAPKK